ncbi:MAG: phage terminase large subunit family protein [Lachnospiraceae bacterium]|nr:phage terminase large subunit family protein [Lachnospiraceae bacterium]
MKKKSSKKKKDALQNVFKDVCFYFKAPENLTVSQWADKHRRLSSENSAIPGRWKTSRTPYLKEIMNAFSDDKVRNIAVVASSQVGKTEAELNMIGYIIDEDPGPAMLVMPSKDMAEDYSKRRISPMIRDTPNLKRKVSDTKSRDSNNTIFKKVYPGGMLTMTGSNSPGPLAGTPARYVFGDEVDRWAKSAGKEGSPRGLLEARTVSFYNAKIVEVSTPTVKGDSPIVESFEKGTQEYWSVKCPDCGEYSFITFDNIHFNFETEKVGAKKQYIVKDVKWACPACGCSHTQSEVRKFPMKWVAKNPEAINKGFRSFWINGFSSPWLQWEYIIQKFLEAKDDPSQLQTVFNTLFGQLWEDRGELPVDNEMLERCEDYDAEVPLGALCLTCGVDTQDNRLEYEVVGHGFYGETWGIEKGVIPGRPDAPDSGEYESVWTRLDRVIDKEWQYSNGKTVKISVTFVDSGGHYTQEVYEQCSKRITKRVFAIKGKGGEGIPYTKPPSKVDIVRMDDRGIERTVGKAWLYVLGVDSGKSKIMSALKVQEAGARFCHFPKGKGYDVIYFNGLLSEKMTLKGKKWQWEKLPGHQRNEALDCRNYALAAETALNPNYEHLYENLHNTTEKVVKKQPKKTYKKQKKRVYQEDW